jgi:hypothetical protein
MSNKEFKMLTPAEILAKPIGIPNKHSVIIDWKNAGLDIIEIENLKAFLDGKYTSAYGFTFDRFDKEPWLNHLAEKGWLNRYDIALIGQAMMYVMNNKYKKPKGVSNMQQITLRKV